IGAVLRVHPSNFRVAGFTARPELPELARLVHRHRVPLIEDLGSGAVVDLEPFGLAHEPTVGENPRAGAAVVTFSGDKLLGASPGSRPGRSAAGARWGADGFRWRSGPGGWSRSSWRSAPRRISSAWRTRPSRR